MPTPPTLTPERRAQAARKAAETKRNWSTDRRERFKATMRASRPPADYKAMSDAAWGNTTPEQRSERMRELAKRRWSAREQNGA